MRHVQRSPALPRRLHGNGSDEAAGATAVQVGTATFWDPRSPVRVAGELADFLKREGVSNVSRLVGSLEM